jgi:hypothetical protein
MDYRKIVRRKEEIIKVLAYERLSKNERGELYNEYRSLRRKENGFLLGYQNRQKDVLKKMRNCFNQMSEIAKKKDESFEKALLIVRKYCHQ